MSGEIDLSGRWTGFFNYPAMLPPTQCEAELRDDGGLISGTTSEPDPSPESMGGTLTAAIDGRREGSSISFLKLYEETNAAVDTVHYHGTILPGGDEIDGRWEIPGHWSGTFLMVRASGAEEEIEESAEVEL